MPSDEELLKTALATPVDAKLVADIAAQHRSVQSAIAARGEMEKQAEPRRHGTPAVIIAGNRGQAELHARRLNLHPYDTIFADNVDRLRGLVDFDVIYTGTWYRRPDLQEIQDLLTASLVARRLRGDDEDRGYEPMAGSSAPNTQAQSNVSSLQKALGHAGAGPVGNLIRP